MKKSIHTALLVLMLALAGSVRGEESTPTPTPKSRFFRGAKPKETSPAATAAPKIKTPPATPAPTPAPKIKTPAVTPAPSVPPKIKAPLATPKPTAKPKLKTPEATPLPSATPKLKSPGVTPAPTTTPKLKFPGVTPSPTVAPKLKFPGVTPVPSATPKLKLPGSTPTSSPKVLIPPKLKIPTPTPTPKVLVPAPKSSPVTTAPPLHGGKPGPGPDVPEPSHLPGLVIRIVPVFSAVRPSEIVYVPSSYAPIPEHAPPPPTATEASAAKANPTGLRAWNGDIAEDQRAFDQTRIAVAPALDGSRTWQFYWQTSLPGVEAARWEIARMPFYPGMAEFPPAGLVAYGDASIDAAAPVQENFFALDFSTFEKVGRPGQ